MKRVLLVTGHTGFVGSALMSALRKDSDFEVMGVARSEGVDLANSDAVRCLPRADRIIHLAGAAGVMSGWQNSRDTYHKNLLPTLHVLEHAKVSKTPVLFMSSYVYGQPVYLPIDEQHPTNGTNPYAHSKRAAEMLAEYYAADFGLPVTILRPFNLYGPSQRTRGLIATIVHQAKYNGLIEINDLRPRRDYLYIDDLVDAVLRAVRDPLPGVAIFNLGCGQSHGVQEVIDMVLARRGTPLPVKCREQMRPNEILDCYCSAAKFTQRYHWAPKVRLEEGLRLMWDAA